MTDQIIQISPDSTGKKLDTEVSNIVDDTLDTKKLEFILDDCLTLEELTYILSLQSFKSDRKTKNIEFLLDKLIFVKCSVCYKEFNIPPQRIKRLNGNEIACSRKCMGVLKTGKSNARYTGQKRIYSNGYVFVPTGIPYKKSIREHILIAEERLGRKLKRGEVVHHIDCDKSNNRFGNLLICTQSYHAFLHQKMAQKWAEEHLSW